MNDTEVELNITAEDIKLGAYSDSKHCPIALAAKRVFGPNVGVGLRHLVVQTVKADNIIYALSPEGREFRYAFDNRLNPAPCKFKVTLAPDFKWRVEV